MSEKRETSKQRILRILMDAQDKPYRFYKYELPRGYVPTGVLHSFRVAGTSARTRISELNKRGIHIESEIIKESNGRRMVNNNGQPVTVNAYRLLTPAEQIDLNECAVL